MLFSGLTNFHNPLRFICLLAAGLRLAVSVETTIFVAVTP